MGRKSGGDQSFRWATLSFGYHGGAAEDEIYTNLWLLCGIYLTFPFHDQHRNDDWLIPRGGDSIAFFQLRWILALVIHRALIHIHQNGFIKSNAVGKVGVNQ